MSDFLAWYPRRNSVTMASDEEVPSEDGKPHAIITQDASDESSSFADEDDDVPLVATATKQSKRAYNTITMGEAPKREDSFDLPAPGPTPWKWEPAVGKKLVVMKDYALAASNAVKEVWEGTDILVGTCAYHASARWLDTKGRKLLRDHDNRALMMADFELFKNCPHLHLVEVLQVAMIGKWAKVYKEPVVAKEWEKVWAACIMTRVELNAGNPLHCWFPSDNNMVESGNKDDKDFFDRKRKGATQFVLALSERIGHVSRADLKFVGRLKQPVNSKDFYKVVNMYRETVQEDTPCFLNLQFPITNQTLDIPKGSFLIATEHCLREMQNVCHTTGTPVPSTPDGVKDWIKKAGWVNQYRAIVNMQNKGLKPEVFSGYGSQFDYYVNFFKTFHLMRPINGDSEDENTAIIEFFGMLSTSDIRNIGIRKLKKKKPMERLLSCDCRQYLHYGWCLHTCAFLMEREIVTSYPTYMDPTGL